MYFPNNFFLHPSISDPFTYKRLPVLVPVRLSTESSGVELIELAIRIALGLPYFFLLVIYYSLMFPRQFNGE